jgi:hypothetical protein
MSRAYPCRRLDAFGNSVIEIAIDSAHSELEIVARSTVELSQREVPPAKKTAPWKAVREVLTYRAGWRPDPAVLEATRFLFESPHARVKRDLRAYAGDCFRPGLPLLEAARAPMSKIYAVCSSIARRSGRWPLASSISTWRLVIKNNLSSRSKKKPVALVNGLSPDRVETRVTASNSDSITIQFSARLRFSFFL